MLDKQPTRGSRRNRQLAGVVGLLLAGGLGGGALAATSSASAADTSTATAPAATGPRADTATPVRAGEVAQTVSALASLKAAALKAVPGGTVYRVETDADGATYEAHMAKADGTRVTVKFDKSFRVTEVQDGMGAGGPARGPADGAPAAPSGAGV